VAATPACPCGSSQACQLRSASEHENGGVMLASSGHIEMSPDGRSASPGTGFDLESARGLRLRVSVSAMGRAHICTVRGEALRYPRC
jgi:hypothetical protein